MQPPEIVYHCRLIASAEGVCHWWLERSAHQCAFPDVRWLAKSLVLPEGVCHWWLERSAHQCAFADVRWPANSLVEPEGFRIDYARAYRNQWQRYAPLRFHAA